MSSAPVFRVIPSDDSWRGPGCGVRCAIVAVTFPGRTYVERVPLHSPEHHEAYGEHVLAHEDAVLRGRIVLTGPLEIHGSRDIALLDGRPLNLTPIEMRILCVLAARIDHACPAREIVRKVWGMAYEPKDAHLVRTNINRLRGKLGTARGLLRTHPKRGYVLLQTVIATEAAS